MIPVHRPLADAAWCFQLGVQAVGQVGDRLPEALRDGRELPLVAGDQRRVGLGAEVAGQVERARGRWVHVISSDPGSPAAAPLVLPAVRRRGATRSPSRSTHALRDPRFRRFFPRPAIMRHDGGLAASPGVRYMLKLEGHAHFFPRRPVGLVGPLPRRRRGQRGVTVGAWPGTQVNPPARLAAAPAVMAGRRRRRDGRR